MGKNQRRDKIPQLLTEFEKEIPSIKSLAHLAHRLVENIKAIISDVTTDSEITNIKDKLAKAENEIDRPTEKLEGFKKNGAEVVEFDVLEALIDNEPDATLRLKFQSLIQTVRAYLPLEKHDILLRI